MTHLRRFALMLALFFGIVTAVRSDDPPLTEEQKKKQIEELKKKIADFEKKLAELSKKDAAPAAEPPSSLLAGATAKMNWRCIGPANMGGRVTSLAVYQPEPTTYYVATASGGLLKTINNGTTFEHQFDRESTVSIGDVAVCQTNPDLVWVGTGEANPRNSVSYGDGVYKSTDGGKKWTNMGLKETFQIGKILIHPKNPDVVYVGALGRLYGPSPERGLFVTRDGGKTWVKSLFVNDRTGVIDAVMDPNDPNTILVAMWERKRDEFDGFFGDPPVPDAYGPVVTHGESGGLWKTTDGGTTWKKLNEASLKNGLPDAKWGRVGLDFSRTKPGLVYAVIDTDKVGTGDPVKQVYMGIIGENAPDKGGAKLTEITKGGPADKAGLKVGDIVVKGNETKFSDYEELTDFIKGQKPDAKVPFVVVRDGKEETITVTILQRPEEQGNFPGRGRQPRAVAGFRFGEDDDGVVSAVTPNGPAEKAGLKAGDKIVAVEGKEISTSNDYTKAVGTDRKVGDKLKITVQRMDKKIDLEITLAAATGQGPNRGASSSKPHQLGLGGQQPNAGALQGKDANNTGGVYKSTDSGTTWTRVNSLNTRPMYFSVIRVDPVDEKIIYLLGDVPVLWKSTNGGERFTTLRTSGGVHADAHAFWINPKNNKQMLIGCDGGFYASYDQGAKWDHLNHLALGQFYHVAADNRKPYRVYGGLQDNGSWGGPSRTTRTYGPVNEDWVFINGGDGFVCRVDPNDPDLVYAESQGGAISRRNFRTGETGFIRPPTREGDPTPRFNWNTPFILSAHNPSIFYSGSEFVWKSVKKGATLKKISPDLTRTKAGSLTAISESPTNADVIWAGSDDGYVWVTRDGGTNWTNVTDAVKSAGVPGYRWVASLEASRERDGRCYLCLDAHRSNDDAPYLFVTEDFGKTWKPLAGTLPKFGSTRCLREDLVNHDVLYCGTEFGAWTSVDRGKTWAKLGGNLPTVAVHEFAQTPSAPEVVAATHGRSLWVIEVASLRQFKAKALTNPETLFGPATYTRWRVNRSNESPYSTTDRKFAGENPPRFAHIDYVLTQPAKSVTIKIIDVNNETVRTINRCANKAGFHRVAWDLTSGASGPSPAPDAVGGGGGLVNNGTYRVVLTVDDRSQAQPIVIEPDPNSPKDAVTRDEEEELENPLRPKKVPARIDD